MSATIRTERRLYITKKKEEEEVNIN